MVLQRATPTTLGHQLEAIGLLKEWTTWLVAIETAAVAAIGAGLKDVVFDPVLCTVSGVLSCSNVSKILASFSVVCLGLSLLPAIYLLLALPSAAQRIDKAAGGDIYAMRTIGWFELRLYYYVRLVRWGAIFGFAILLALILMIIWTHSPAKVAVS